MTTYYYTLASTKFFLEEEPVEEILRERLHFYDENNLNVDFCFIKKIDTLEVPELISLQEKFRNELSAIISTNPHFIDWLKLRLQYVLTGEFTSETFSLNNNFIKI
uniref:hypothetical protein n=1 Tax=Rhodaphanes brevistipitata TaxID=446136 RepID=UPI001FCE172C|nr:hypothetical protein MW432_pgp087 [Rhodaphanes brevistipitata]UNJ18494.1 hypothetical protein [Rhodaphanes brevistipitata]